MIQGFHEEDSLGRAYDARLVRRLLGFLRPYRGQVALAVLLLLGSALLQLAGPVLTRATIDRAIPARDATLLAQLALAFAAALALEFLVEYAQAMLTARIGQSAMLDLRTALFQRLQRLPIRFFDRNPVGRLMTRVTSDVEALNELFTTGVVALAGDALTLVAITVWMFVVDWKLALAAYVVVPGIAIAAQVFRVRLREAYRDIRVRLAALNAFLQEHISGMRVVQLFGREAGAYMRHDQVNRAHLDAHLRSIVVFAFFFPVLEVLIAVALAALLLAGGHRVLGDSLTLGTLTAFLQLARRFFMPLQDLAEKLNAVQSAVTSSERIFRLLDEPEAIADPPQAVKPASRPRGEIVFEDVWFRYADDQPWVLRGVSFEARAGETVALVGRTGAGKTTIISLLLRFHEPDRGRVLVDGVDVRRYAQHDLRGMIGLVQQDLFLFTGDLRSNVALDRGLPDGAVERAAGRVGVDRLVSRLPAGWSHRLGERGQNLSVGERQLVAFARALAGEPPILVLDEATSSVDAETEARIQAAIEELMRGRTALVVAHRLSTVQHASAIMVLHGGEIVERGTHQELLRLGGIYEKLYHLQLRGNLGAVS